MQDVDKIFENIEATCHINSGNFEKHKIRIKNKRFGYRSIFKIIEHLKWVINNEYFNSTIKIVIDSEVIPDDASLIIFETIIYDVLKKYNLNISYVFNINNRFLGYELFRLSNLYKFNDRFIDRQEFIQKYEQRLDINKNRFRKITYNNKDNLPTNYLSITMSEFATFLSSFNLEKEYIDDLIEVISEIVGNAIEHSDGDCIVDVKVLNHKKRDYKFVSITSISIGDIFIGSEIKEFVNNSDKSGYSSNNKIVINAYNNQKDMFSSEYDIDSFAMVSAYQKYVTTRINPGGTGGSGLTTLIQALIEKSENNYCYSLSGNNIIFFNKPFLNLTEDGLIGFNEINDYMNNIPSMDAVKKIGYKFNCTVYNLMFVVKEMIE